MTVPVLLCVLLGWQLPILSHLFQMHEQIKYRVTEEDAGLCSFHLRVGQDFTRWHGRQTQDRKEQWWLHARESSTNNVKIKPNYRIVCSTHGRPVAAVSGEGKRGSRGKSWWRRLVTAPRGQGGEEPLAGAASRWAGPSRAAHTSELRVNTLALSTRNSWELTQTVILWVFWNVSETELYVTIICPQHPDDYVEDWQFKMTLIKGQCHTPRVHTCKTTKEHGLSKHQQWT